MPGHRWKPAVTQCSQLAGLLTCNKTSPLSFFIGHCVQRPGYSCSLLDHFVYLHLFLARFWAWAMPISMSKDNGWQRRQVCLFQSILVYRSACRHRMWLPHPVIVTFVASQSSISVFSLSLCCRRRRLVFSRLNHLTSLLDRHAATASTKHSSPYTCTASLKSLTGR